MGNSNSNEGPKEKIYSISYLLQKLSSNLIADKKLLQTLTIIENKLHRLSSALTNEFCVNNGAAILLGIIKSNIQGIYSINFNKPTLIRRYFICLDIEVVRICVSGIRCIRYKTFLLLIVMFVSFCIVFDILKHDARFCCDIFEAHGIELLLKIKAIYLHDAFIGVTLPGVLALILGIVYATI